jgi:tRNA pseudouridine13 synthase
LKLKQRAEDFRVEEESRLEAGPEGAFALYRLEKRGIGTPEAIRVVARAWRLGPRDFGYAGLKDKYGVTGQVVSVRSGPRRNFSGKGFTLNYLGRSARPAARGTIARNRFTIVLRDLAQGEAERVLARERGAAAHGIPNYYDDQRFGSLRGTRGRFVARALLAGDHEEALRLANACPAREDRSRIKRRRTLLRDRWGRWDDLARALDPSLEQRICRRLAGGAPFADAYREIDAPIRALHLSAFQAHLFNACLRRALPGDGPRHKGVAGPYVFFRGDPGPLRDTTIPLFSAGAPADDLLDAVLPEEGLDRAQAAPFRPGRRRAIVVPDALECGDPEPDDANKGRLAVRLAFTLPSGAYATILVKRTTHS